MASPSISQKQTSKPQQNAGLSSFEDLGAEEIPQEQVDKFDDIVSFTLGDSIEGGYTVDHAGPTNRGVTQTTFDRYRKDMGLPIRDVKTIRNDEVYDLYASDYYEKYNIDKLPHKVAGVVFDYGVNSGPNRAIKDLQSVLGVKQDGDLGPKTQAAVNAFVDKNGEKVLAEKIINKREKFMQGLIENNPDKYKKFKNGWDNRIKMLRDKYTKVADGMNPFHVGEASADEGGLESFSDLGAEPVDDFSDLGAEPIEEQPTPEQVKAAKTPIFERIGKGFGTGVAGMVEGVGGVAKWFGHEKLGESINKYADEMMQHYEVPDPDFTSQVAAGAGSMATFMIPGLGIARGVNALSAMPRLATWLGVSASSVMEASVEAGGAYNKMIAKGMDHKEASTAATKDFWLNLPVLVYTNKFGIFGDGGGMILKGLKSASGEAVQEFSQQLIGNFSTKDPLMEGALESAAVGAIVGGGTGMLMSAAERKDVEKIKAKDNDAVIEEAPVSGDTTAKFEEVSTDVAKPAETISVNVTPEMREAVESGAEAVEVQVPTEVKAEPTAEHPSQDVVEDVDVGKESQEPVKPEVTNDNQNLQGMEAGAGVSGEEGLTPDEQPVAEAIKKGMSEEEFVKSNKIAYHGTDAEFNVFDEKKIGSKNDLGFFGKGIYFSEDAGEAKAYGKKIVEANLKLKKPFDLRTKSNYLVAQQMEMVEKLSSIDELAKKEVNSESGKITLGEVANIINEVKNKAKISEHGNGGFVAEYKQPKGFELQKQAETKEDAIYLLAGDVLKYKGVKLPDPSVMPRHLFGSENFSNTLKNNGFDSVRAENEIVVFSPSQIKTVSDLRTLYRQVQGKMGQKPAQAEQKPVGKEPWQMKARELADYTLDKYNGDLQENVFGDTRPKMRRGDRDYNTVLKEHKIIVEQAISEGKPVPPEVLAEYPELKKEPVKVEQTVVEPIAQQAIESDWEKTKRQVAEAQARWEKEKAERAEKKPLPSVAESAIESSRVPDAPVPGKQYQLTGTKTPSIASGNTWADSEVKQPTDNAALIKDMVEYFSKRGSIIKDALETRKLAGVLFGGDPKTYYDELYDSMEMGLNRQFREKLLPLGNFKDKMMAAIEMEGMLPLRNRSLETIKNQQFSTPLSLATAANHLLDPQNGDIILEPTAGTGNLIVPFWNGEWKLIANELDPRRLEVLKHSGESIDIQSQDFLKYNGPNPTAIISNPPFGGLSTGKYASFAADFEASNLDQRFIAKMLRLLPDGGRIAVITSQGSGSGMSGAPFRKWLEKEHTLIASIASPEGAYKHRGSPTIGTALFMIEKGKRRGPVKSLIRESVSGWDEYVSIIDTLKNQYPRLESGAILKSGRIGNNEIQNPTAPVVRTEPTGQSAGLPSRGSERGGSVESVNQSTDRVASVPTEQPEGSRIVADDLEQGTANVGTGERPVNARVQDRKIVGSFIQYKRHNTLPIVSPHPSVIVESQELASVNPPPLTYKPGQALESAYRNKKISDEQMDVVLQTMQSIARGKGQLIADDVGVGKTREMAGIILDALDTGKVNRVLYVTKSQEVLNNHIATDFSEVMTGKPGMPLPFQTVRLDGMPKLSEQSNIPVSDKSLYTITRDKLKGGYKNVMDVGFDLVVFDEAHEWRPANEKQAKYIAWTAIHDAMRGKPMVYVTATPGIDLASLDYLYGLGEWSKGTFDQYIASITGQEAQKKGMFSGRSNFASAGSIPMTQQFMRELKMKGLYSSRDLSRQNVKFESKTVKFTSEDMAAYDRYTAFLLKAYKTGVKYAKFNKVSGAKGLGLIKSMMQNAAKRHQVDLKMTRIIEDVKKDISDGKRVFLFTSGLNELDADAPKGYVRAVIDAINENQVESVEGEVISDKIPESIEEKELLKDELNSLPPQLSIEKYVKEILGKNYKIGFYTGNTTESNKKKYLKEWMEGKIDVMLGSDAAKTAISAHDIIGKPIVNYYLDVDFEVTKFKQALGRTNRAGERTSPTIIIPGIGSAGEQKFIATIASRMKSLGATSKGQAESGVVDFLSEFDLDGAIAHQAARNTFSGINDTDKELFLNEKLYENIGGQRVPRRVPPQNYYVDQFLYDLNFMPYEDGNRMFKLLIENYKDILDKSARTAELIAERTGGTEVKHTELYRNPDNPNDYVTLHEVLDKTGHRFGIVSGMLLDKTKDLVRYEIKHFVKFQTPNGLISGKKVLPSHIVALAKFFGKDMASTITFDNAFDVIMSGDKVPVGGEMNLYLRQDGSIGIQNAKMADKIILQRAGATFRPVGSAWVLKDKSKDAVKEFLRSFPIRGASNKQSISEVEKALGETTTDDNIKYMNLGPVPLPSARKMVNDEIKGVVKFSDPDVEARFRSAKGVSVIGLRNKLNAFMEDLKARMTRTYPTLPNKPEYAEIRNILSKQQVNRQVSNERAIRALDAITAGFGPKKLDLFTRKVILDDLSREIEAGRAIPFGYSRYSEDGGVITDTEMFAKDKANIDYLINQNNDLKEALSKRKMLWEAIQSDLVSYGILDEQQVKQDYFRHQVLDYARLKATQGTGKKLRTPTPGYARRRGGSTSDINTDYVQAEFEVMAQAMHDIETAKNIRKIENSRLNIVSDLRDQAREQSDETGEKIDWHTLIPDGYTTWQPKEGNVFYMANSVPDKVLNAALENITGMGIDPQDLKKVMAIGSKRKEFVLPEDVAKTLDNLYTNKNVNAIAEGAKTITNYWKRWILTNPRRALKYNYQNFIGDFDAVIAGDPKILTQFGRSFSELSDVMFRGKPMPSDMKEFFERGGLSAQMTVNELPELRNLEIFQRLLDSSPASDLKRQLNLWQKYWQGINTLTTFREAIFRYAAYLHYKDMFTKGGRVNYGSSIKSEIDNISDPLDKSAKVATELLGDYANLTAFGKDMREAVAPFYSWLEVNAKRYSRLTRNAFEDGWQKGIKTSATIAGIKGSFFLATWMVRAAAMTALIALYNHIHFPDEEEELPEYDRNRMHIILGRNPDGTIAILRGQTAFADLLEWFGLDASPTLWREYHEGKTSIADIYGRIPFTDMPAFGLNPMEGKIGLHQAVMKIVRGINPLYKLPVETMTGSSLPVFDDKSWRIEDKFKNIAKALSLENEYDFVARKPSRGYLKSWKESLISTSDPEESAYRYIQSEKYKFLETVKGRGGSGDYYSPRSLLYREYKKALKVKDEFAIAEARKKIDAMGITEKELNQSLKMSDPLSGLSREDKAEFTNHYLTDRERNVLLPKANKYYTDTFVK